MKIVKKWHMKIVAMKIVDMVTIPGNSAAVAAIPAAVAAVAAVAAAVGRVAV